MEIDLNELERLAKAATRGPWEVVETKVPHYRGGKHTERRIFTANDDPQLKEPYPIVNMSFGLPENEGGAAVKLVSIFEENADYIAAANPSVVLELVRRLRAAETALDAAQACVKEDRDALIVWHRNPATGIVDDELAAVWLAEYNHVLKVIADAMQPSKDRES